MGMQARRGVRVPATTIGPVTPRAEGAARPDGGRSAQGGIGDLETMDAGLASWPSGEVAVITGE